MPVVFRPDIRIASSTGFSAKEQAMLMEAVEQNRELRGGMSTSAKALRFDDFAMWVELDDGRTLGVPLAWFPRLLHATHEQRLRYEISADGLHWDEIDEDISVNGLLAGRGDCRRRLTQ